MKQSQYFLRTSKTKPAEDISVNAVLLEQGGFVQKVMAGVYSFLPLGLKVLWKIENLVRQEMQAIGASEVLMPTLHPKDNWLATKRWNDLDILFKIKSQHGYEYALGPTHEEIVTPMALAVINSYKDLPLAVFQIQTKFRDEPRAKSGLLRGREFRMKDLYSFHADAEDLEKYYTQVAIPAYRRIFQGLGLDALLTEASGGTFAKFSHEFQVETENGEDAIFVCKKCGLAKNKEIFNQIGASSPPAPSPLNGEGESNKEKIYCTNCGQTAWRESKASEVGNIFKLQDKYSQAFNLQYTDLNGAKRPVLMGCYGLGTSRLMGVLVEKFHDGKGIVWPQPVAPFLVHLLALKGAETQAEKIYENLQRMGIEVLYDDRPASPGVKFADADLIGVPYRMVVSEKTLEQDSVELKERAQGKTKLIKIKDLNQLFNK